MLKVHTLNDQICPHFNDAAHGVEIPPGARLLFTNGQVGARPDGSVPESPSEQLEVIFERLKAVLTASDMGFADVVRFTVYATDMDYFDDFQRVSARELAGHKPAAILLLVDSFPRPGVQVEVEAIAAKAD
ncbi:MAG: RidA family protein [Hyphomicrobiaceae bacterium]|nr:RidA family protein [Hyphomicrobiaceae bacterium]